MMISLRAGGKVYVNGAVIRADRKVNLELLNDVTFLLEAHVLQPQEATTPLRQLYFVVQTILMDPSGAAPAKDLLATMLARLERSFMTEAVRCGLKSVREQVDKNRPFEALRTIRSLYPIEAAILGGETAAVRAA